MSSARRTTGSYKRDGFLAGLLILLVAAGLAGCAHPARDCAGTGSSPVAALECRSMAGDKLAQLALGRRYEDGHGVKRSPQRAAALYRQAAAFTSGTTYIYSPPVGKAPGSVIPVRTGPDQPGLAEAKYRLALLHLSGKGARFDIKKARTLLSEAGAQGFLPARLKLEELDRLPRA
jgi:TPR repeat protein